MPNRDRPPPTDATAAFSIAGLAAVHLFFAIDLLGSVFGDADWGPGTRVAMAVLLAAEAVLLTALAAIVWRYRRRPPPGDAGPG